MKQLVTGAHISRSPSEWQVLQRDESGQARVELEGTWASDEEVIVQARAVRENENAAVEGCDWSDVEATGEASWRTDFRLPAGGPYRLETRLRAGGDARHLTGEKKCHVFVGDLWVIAGQSNAVGFGHGPAFDPPVLGVSVFGLNEVWRLATHPVFDPTDTRHPANHDSSWVDVSPWLAFGRQILIRTGIPVGLLPAAKGGSSISSWDPGSNDPYLYRNMEDLIQAAGGSVAGMAWYQGCSDAGRTSAADYLERFLRLAQALRRRYGTGLPILTAQLNRFLDAAPGDDDGWSAIREAQRQAARRTTRLAVVPTLDLPLCDSIHTSAAGNIILGERFAQAALGMVYQREPRWRSADLSALGFVDGDRTRIRLVFADAAGPLHFLSSSPPDFRVIDEEGAIPLTACRVECPSDVILSLSRAAKGRTSCSCMHGANPPSSLRDRLLRPILAFSEVEVPP